MGKIIQDYLLQQQLGSGAFGKVFKAFNIKTNEIVAIKVIPKLMFKLTPKLEQCLENEIKILNLMTSNPHIVTLIKAFKSLNNFYMVYQYCNGSTLASFLKTRKQLSQHQAYSFFIQLISSFKDLYRHQILHRDIKPQNIFLHNGKLKLGDFGFCKTLKSNETVTTTMVGSPIYMAPEVIKGQAYTAKADIWSLGVVLYEMLYGVCPFESNSIAGLILTLHNNHLMFPKTGNVSEKMLGLLGRMLEKDQFKRISWEELIRVTDQEVKQKELKVKEQQITRIPLARLRSNPICLTRPISNHLTSPQPSPSLYKPQKQFRRPSSSQKPTPTPLLSKNPQSPRQDTNSTTNASCKASMIQEPNLSSRFQLNRLLNNSSKQLEKEISILILTFKTGTYLTKMMEIQWMHGKLVEAANLAVDIFIDDQKDGMLYYYLILNKVKLGLSDLIPNILPQQSTLKAINTIKTQFTLLQKQLIIFRDYLMFKGVIVDDILDIPTYLKIKSLGLSENSELWRRMEKYFSGESELEDNRYLRFNHSYSAKNSIRKEEGDVDEYRVLVRGREKQRRDGLRVGYY